MKTMKLTILLTLTSLVAFGQGSYEQAMSKSIMEIYSAQEPSKLTYLANKFNRISQAETDKWAPKAR